jgi:hypothetical protein
MSNAAVLLDARHPTTSTTLVTGDKTKAAQAANHACTPAAQVGAVRGMVSGAPSRRFGLLRPPGAPVDLDVRAPVARRQVLEHRERDLWSMCAVDAVIDACREDSTSSSLAGCGLPRRQGQRKADHCWSASCEHCLLCCCCWWSSTIANHAKRQRLSELWLLLLQRPRGAFCV